MKLEDPGKKALLVWGLWLAFAIVALGVTFMMDNGHALQAVNSRAASVQQ